MAKFNWDKINVENLDHRHRLQLERQAEEGQSDDGANKLSTVPVRLKTKSETAKYIESIRFDFDSSAINVIQRTKPNCKKFKIKLRTLPIIRGISFELNLEMTAKPGKLINWAEPLTADSKTKGYKSILCLNEEYFERYALRLSLDNVPLINLYSILLTTPAITDKITQLSDSEVSLKADINCIGHPLSLNLTIFRDDASLNLKRAVGFPLLDSGHAEMQLTFNQEFVRQFIA